MHGLMSTTKTSFLLVTWKNEVGLSSHMRSQERFSKDWKGGLFFKVPVTIYIS